MSARRITDRRIWSDRPGEAWLCVADAARAVGRARTARVLAIDHPTKTSAGRRWFTEPPAWATAETPRPPPAVRAPVLGGPVGAVCPACGRAGGHWRACDGTAWEVRR